MWTIFITNKQNLDIGRDRRRDMHGGWRGIKNNCNTDDEGDEIVAIIKKKGEEEN